jgi:hypothetical protein
MFLPAAKSAGFIIARASSALQIYLRTFVSVCVWCSVHAEVQSLSLPPTVWRRAKYIAAQKKPDSRAKSETQGEFRSARGHVGCNLTKQFAKNKKERRKRIMAGAGETKTMRSHHHPSNLQRNCRFGSDGHCLEVVRATARN